MTISNPADFYLDFRQFGDLRLKARGDTDEAARAVAQQFEGLLVQQMLKAMRAAAEVDAGQHGSYVEYYREMYDKQLAQTLASQDRLGVARMILRQLPGTAGTDARAAADGKLEPPVRGAAAHPAVAAAAPATPPAAAAAPVAATDAARVRLGRVVDDDFAEVSRGGQAHGRWRDPGRFVADIWPRARAAAGDLGISPELLVAQAALETGWGRHTMRFDDGRSSHNLFGIKAGAAWSGSTVRRPSLEFRDGVLQSEVSHFRAYASPARSIEDYVDFVRSNPRYQRALAEARAGDDRAYIRELQRAGYATDPRYADKVIGILHGETLERTLASLDSGVV